MWEQVGILILIGLISLIDWILRKSRERRAKQKLQKQQQEPVNPYVATSPRVETPPPVPMENTEQLKSFMEALGLPVSEPAQRTPAQKISPTPSPYAISHPPQSQLSRRAESRHSQKRISKPTDEQRALAKTLSGIESKSHAKSSAGSSRTLQQLFLTPKDLQRAVLAREILGSPLALRNEEMGDVVRLDV